MNIKILLTLIMGVILYGCSATKLSYTPTDNGNIAHSIAVFKESLQHQSPNHEVKSVEINHDYIKILNASNSKTNFIHFDVIGNIELHEKDEWRIVTIRSLDNSILYRLYVDDDEIARNFMDAIFTLKHHWREIGQELNK